MVRALNKGMYMLELFPEVAAMRERKRESARITGMTSDSCYTTTVVERTVFKVAESDTCNLTQVLSILQFHTSHTGV